MRRALILPTVTILLLLGLCIANGLLLRQHTDRWSGMAAETARYARSERWPEARRELDALAADWDEAQSYLHIVVHHSTLGEVQTLLTRCRTLCDTGTHRLCCRSWQSCNVSWMRWMRWSASAFGISCDHFSLRSLFSSLMKVLMSLN